MANRTTVKSNIIAKNVPTITNAKLTDILNNEIAENVKFREDVATSQTSAVSNINLDFTGKDRIDLTRTGGTINISVTNIGDGETKFILITKTAGQAVTFVGVTDVTPIKANANAVSLILYEVVRKGANFFAHAWVESVVQASDTVLGVMQFATVAENNALVNTTKPCVPGRLPISGQAQRGLIRQATNAEYAAGTANLSTSPAQIVSSNFVKLLAKGVKAIGDIDGDGYQEYVVAFDAALPDTNYKIIGEIEEQTSNRPSAWGILKGSKTIAQFTMWIWARDNSAVQNITFNWSAIAL